MADPPGVPTVEGAGNCFVYPASEPMIVACGEALREARGIPIGIGLGGVGMIAVAMVRVIGAGCGIASAVLVGERRARGRWHPAGPAVPLLAVPLVPFFSVLSDSGR